MEITQTRAYYGLRSAAKPTSPTVTGTPQIGIAMTNVNLTDVNSCYAIEALIVGPSSDLVIDSSNGDKAGSTAWTSGSPQVESATLSLGTGTSGSLNVVVTSSGMVGSPLTVAVAINHTVQNTAALVAQKIVDTLNANATVSGRFTASRSTATVKLTRKPRGTYTVGNVSVSTYLVGDASEFAIPTALGVTGATSTTGAGADAGVATAGCYIVGDGVDFEGVALESQTRLGSVTIYHKAESIDTVTISTASTLTNLPLQTKGVLSLTFPDCNGSAEVFTISGANESVITLVVAGAVD